jgi:hypothetical protein
VKGEEIMPEPEILPVDEQKALIEALWKQVQAKCGKNMAFREINKARAKRNLRSILTDNQVCSSDWETAWEEVGNRHCIARVSGSRVTAIYRYDALFNPERKARTKVDANAQSQPPKERKLSPEERKQAGKLLEMLVFTDPEKRVPSEAAYAYLVNEFHVNFPQRAMGIIAKIAGVHQVPSGKKRDRTEYYVPKCDGPNPETPSPASVPSPVFSSQAQPVRGRVSGLTAEVTVVLADDTVGFEGPLELTLPGGFKIPVPEGKVFVKLLSLVLVMTLIVGGILFLG